MGPQHGGVKTSLKRDLWLIFFFGAVVVRFVAPRVPAFDTSHLIQRRPFEPANHDSAATSSILEDMNTPEELSSLVPLPSLRWDTLHYLDIAAYGTYAYEHQYAFSPGVPVILRLLYSIKLYSLNLIQGATGFSSSSSHVLMVHVFDLVAIASLALQPCLGIYR